MNTVHLNQTGVPKAGPELSQNPSFNEAFLNSSSVKSDVSIPLPAVPTVPIVRISTAQLNP